MSREPHKKPVPQTVEALQKEMASDAVLIEKMDKENGKLRSKINSLQAQLKKAKKQKAEIVRLVNGRQQ